MNSPAIPAQPEPPSPGLTIRLLGDFSLWYRGKPIATVNTPASKPSSPTCCSIATRPKAAAVWPFYFGPIQLKRRR